jgi:hypothetical protein
MPASAGCDADSTNRGPIAGRIEASGSSAHTTTLSGDSRARGPPVNVDTAEARAFVVGDAAAPGWFFHSRDRLMPCQSSEQARLPEAEMMVDDEQQREPHRRDFCHRQSRRGSHEVAASAMAYFGPKAAAALTREPPRNGAPVRDCRSAVTAAGGRRWRGAAGRGCRT